MTRQAPFQSSRDLVEAKKELQGNQRMASHDPRIRTAGKILPLSGIPKQRGVQRYGTLDGVQLVQMCSTVSSSQGLDRDTVYKVANPEQGDLHNHQAHR